MIDSTVKMDVVTHQNWIADEFKTLRNFDVVQNFGFDPPRENAVVWCPGDYAAKCYASNIDLGLLSAGPKWLANLDYKYTSRRLWAGNADDMYKEYGTLQTFRGKVHGKLAEAKNDKLPAKVYDNWREFAAHLNKFNIPLEANVQISSLIDYVAEARFFCGDKKGPTQAVYRLEDYFYDDPYFMTKGIKSKYLHMFLHEAADFYQDLKDNVDMPPGVVIDIGKDADGNLSVVEANAAWSSNIYGVPAQSLIKAVRLSQRGDAKWRWKPDASQLQNVRPFK